MIVKTPGICGGKPRIGGTRIPVWTLEVCRRQGETVEAILADFPSLTRSDIEMAWRYADEHRREIGQQVRENTT